MEVSSISLPAVSSGSTTFQNVNLRQTYSAPPLIFLLPAHENPEPTALRIRNVTNTTFEISQVEPPGEDAVQPATTVHYMAIEAGVHQLPDGTIIEAGSFQTTNLQHGNGVAGVEAWSTVNFTTTFAANPAVLAEVQTMANVVGNPPGAVSVPWLTASMQAVGTTSVQLALELSEVNDAGGAAAVVFNETIAYLAVNSSMAGSFIDNLGASVNYETMHTARTIAGWGNGCYNYGFSAAYAAPPLVIAHGNTHYGGDGGWLRRCAVPSNTDIWITYDEDQDQNAERNHTTEEAGILIFSQAFDADIVSAPVADYHFDECDLSGGIVADSQAGNDGTINGAVATSLTGALCKSGNFNGGTVELAGLPVSAVAGDRTTVMFWMNWDGTNSVMPFGWQFHDLWFVNDRFGFNTASSDIYGISGANAKLANGWHHIAAVFVNGDVSQEKLYIDGLPQAMSQQLGSPNNSLAYVQANARISGWLADNGYRFSGQLDEVIIFNGEIAAAQIYSIYNNQNSGRNYNGSLRTCTLCSTPLAEWHLNECFWNGTPNEVIDSGANGYHGTANNTTTSATAQLCRSGDFLANGITDYVDLDYRAANGLEDFTLSLWVKTTNPSNQQQAIFSGAGANNNEMLLFLPNNLTLSTYINGANGNISIPNIADDNWHHIAWTRNGTQNCIYFDNSLRGCVNLAGKTNPLVIGNGGLILGQEQDNVGGGFSATQDFEGYIDQVKIFNTVLTAEEVNTLYNETSAGCNACQTPIADWQFDECSPAATIADSTGNGFDGATQGNTDTISNGALCRTGDFDGAGDYLDMGDIFNNIFGTTNSDFTFTAWLYPTALTAAQTNHQTRNTFAAKASDPFNDNLEIGVNQNGTVHIYMDTAGANTFADFGIAGAVALNNWNFVAVSYDGNTVKTTINGATYTNSTTWNGGGNFSNAAGSPFTIGASIHIDNFFTGQIDEAQLYDSVLSSADLQTVRNNYLAGQNSNGSTRTCAVCGTGVDHYEIRHDGTAITCNPESITIVACEDAACSTLYSGAVNLTLTAAGNTSGQVDNTALSFSGGTTTYLLRHTTPEVVTLSINAPDPAPTNTATCLNTTTSTASCDITYYEAGFIFDVVTPQISCQTSAAVTISAVRMDITTQQCVPGFTSRTENIGFWSTYVTPATGSQPVSINGTGITTSSPGTDISLAFDGNGQSTFTVSYDDAGDMQLNTRFNGTGVESGLLMQGNDTFIVKPDRFIIRAYDPGNNDLDGTITWAAGDNFNFDITATCADGTTVTQNYLPTGNDRIRMRVERTAPADVNSQDRTFTIDGLGITDSTAPVFQNAQIAASSFINGSFNDNAADYNDVGILNITVQDNNYFGQTFSSPAGGLTAGRFTPDHFEVTSNAAPVLADGCVTGNFTYLDEPFGYNTGPSITITARNVGNTTTQNYEGNFWKLGEPFTLNYSYTDNSGTGLYSSPLTSSVSAIAGATTNCNGTLTLNLADTFTYSRPAATSPQAPFGANLDLNVIADEFTDTDLVCYKTGILCLGLNIAAISGTDLRHGRIKVYNNYGPETADITGSPYEIHYYDGTGWIVNPADSCTAEGTLTFCAEGTHTAAVDTGTLSAGAGTLTVTTTNAAETVRVCPTAPADLTSLSVCTAANPMCGNFTFGIFRGNDRFINWQEIVR